MSSPAGQTKMSGINVEDIEQQLTSLWDGFEADRDGGPVIRACSMNLIVLAGEESELPAVNNVLDSIAADHPARTFLVAADASNKSPEAWVGAKCSVPLPGEKQVCSEQINLRVPDDALSLIPSVVSSLVVPDIPLVLFVPGAAVPDRLMEVLTDAMDFILLDTAGEPDLDRLLALANAPQRMPFRDLAWERTELWRRAMSHIFDEADALRRLPALRRMTVSYGRRADPRRSGLTGALLFAGWVKLCLGGSDLGAGEQPDIRVVAADESGGDASIRSVECRFDDDSTWVLSLPQEGSCPHLVRTSGGRRVSESAVPVRGEDAAARMIRLLTLQDFDETFLESLLVAGRDGSLMQ